jgi:catechol 2,3-dioxygenase-like lactoylglutathione lyase family enzyme
MIRHKSEEKPVGLELAKPVIDIGIVTTDAEASAGFYGGVLGLAPLPDVGMDGFTIRRFQIGDCVLKILQFDSPPERSAAGGGLGDATGIRYWTVSVTNLDQVLDACRSAGRPIVEGPTEVRPGVSIALVADPDGNIVEFVNRPAA